MLRLFIYKLEDVPENEDFRKVKAVGIIEGDTNKACEEKAMDMYGFNDYGWTYNKMIA